MYMDRETILRKIRENREKLKNLGLSQIGLFGSYARNENNEESDIDLIIDFKAGEKNFHNYMEACDILEDIIKVKIDIVTSESISPHIKPYIDNEVIYERL